MNEPAATSILGRIHAALLQMENWIVVFILIAMLLIAVAQIFLRNFFGFGVVWAETLVRVLVLWISLIGAMVATRYGKHINIDILTRYLSPQAKNAVSALVNFFTAAVCAVIMYYSIHFIVLEYDDGSLAFANVPNWLCETIIPIAFFVMGGRYLNAFVADLFHLVRRAT